MLRRIATPVIAAALVALAFPLTACAQPSARVLTRDSNTGGPTELRLDDLAPLFDGERATALSELSAGRPAAAIEAFRAPAADEPGLSAFVLTHALYTDGQYGAVDAPASTCAAEAPLFADHCLYWAADAALRTDRPTAAERYAAMVDGDTVFGPRSRFVRGRALAALERYDEAIDVLAAFLDDYPRAWYRADVEFALGAAYESLEQWDNAARVYHRVALLNPGDRDERAANEALEAIASRVTPAVLAAIEAPPRDEVIERAEVLLDRRRHDEVVDLLTPLLSSLEPGDDTFCRGNYLVGKSLRNERDHTDSLPFFQAVIDHCDGELRMFALYNGGLSAWTRDQDARAFDMFESLWTDFASESYADDAMLLGARVTADTGDTAAYQALLRQQIAAFPNGDMLGDAVWRLGQQLYDDGQHAEFVAFVDDLGTTTGERTAYSRGRLGYFRARSLERMGLRNEAIAGYRDVVERHPMTWFALLAFNRLHRLDRDGTAALVAQLRAGDGSAPDRIEVRPAEVGHDPAFRRGTTLVRLGLFDLAEDEFDRLSARYPNEDELGWVLSALYDHVGAYNRSYRVPGGLDIVELGYPNDANRERWELAFPRPFAEDVRAASAARGLDPYVVWAVMRQESGFRPDAHSAAGARGLLQLMVPTANDMARRVGRGEVSASELFEPSLNIELGTEMLLFLSDRYDGVAPVYLPAYNAGLGRVDRWSSRDAGRALDEWVEHIPIDQARHYAKGVTMRYWTYRWLYGTDDEAILVLPERVGGS